MPGAKGSDSSTTRAFFPWFEATRFPSIGRPMTDPAVKYDGACDDCLALLVIQCGPNCNLELLFYARYQSSFNIWLPEIFAANLRTQSINGALMLRLLIVKNSIKRIMCIWLSATFRFSRWCSDAARSWLCRCFIFLKIQTTVRVNWDLSSLLLIKSHIGHGCALRSKGGRCFGKNAAGTDWRCGPCRSRPAPRARYFTANRTASGGCWTNLRASA